MATMVGIAGLRMRWEVTLPWAHSRPQAAPTPSNTNADGNQVDDQTPFPTKMPIYMPRIFCSRWLLRWLRNHWGPPSLQHSLRRDVTAAKSCEQSELDLFVSFLEKKRSDHPIDCPWSDRCCRSTRGTCRWNGETRQTLS